VTNSKNDGVMALPPLRTKLPDTVNLAGHYRQKAAECVRFAESAADEFTRDEWLKMANGWTQLALHSDR
jgi:hypothetical protein